MDYETRTLSEVLATASLSFDAECWPLTFQRQIPIAIYVDAGDRSNEFANRIQDWMSGTLEEMGFTPAERLGEFSGSVLQLHLSGTKDHLNGASFGERLGKFRERLGEYVRKELWKDLKQGAKDAGTVLKIAVAVGNFVLLVSAGPATPIVIGAIVIPAKVWMILSAAKSSSDVAELAGKLFFENDAAKSALESPAEQPAPVSAAVSNKSLRELQEEVRHLQEQFKNLRKEK